jgi:hypothetical protein
LGEAAQPPNRRSGPLSKEEKDYILAGMKKLPLREQIEIQPFVNQRSIDWVELGIGIKRLARFLEYHENELVAKPKWDGMTN